MAKEVKCEPILDKIVKGFKCYKPGPLTYWINGIQVSKELFYSEEENG